MVISRFYELLSTFLCAALVQALKEKSPLVNYRFILPYVCFRAGAGRSLFHFLFASRVRFVTIRSLYVLLRIPKHNNPLKKKHLQYFLFKY